MGGQTFVFGGAQRTASLVFVNNQKSNGGGGGAMGGGGGPWCNWGGGGDIAPHIPSQLRHCLTDFTAYEIKGRLILTVTIIMPVFTRQGKRHSRSRLESFTRAALLKTTIYYLKETYEAVLAVIAIMPMATYYKQISRKKYFIFMSSKQDTLSTQHNICYPS